MKTFAKRARAAIGLGLLWAVGGIAVGGALELLDNILPAAHPLTRLVDMWPQTLALLGLLAGTLFGVILGIAGARRRFQELSLPWLTACGALSGVLLGVLLGAPMPIVGVITAASAIAGAGSLTLARWAERRELLGAAAEDDRLPMQPIPRELPRTGR